MRILVVDDEQMIRDLATRILTRAGFEVDTAESGQTGVDRFTQASAGYDLVLLDLSMEDMSGEEALRKMRAIAPDVPCIISSGLDLSEMKLPTDLQKATHFLEKPYRARQLSDLVNDILAM